MCFFVVVSFYFVVVVVIVVGGFFSSISGFLIKRTVKMYPQFFAECWLACR